MNAEEVTKLSRQVANHVAIMIQSHWDQIAHKGQSDPKMVGLADVAFKVVISTLGNDSHRVHMTINHRPVKDVQKVTPSDAELPDADHEDDPGSVM